MSRKDPQRRQPAREEATGEIPLAEWIAAAVGLALVLATIGFLAWRALAQDSAPPAIAVRAESVERVANGYLVRIRAENRGDRTAADVKVDGALKSDAGTVESAETTFKYLPPRSEREGGLFFTNDPRKFRLELRALGYEAP